jgi:hypothetical protein
VVEADIPAGQPVAATSSAGQQVLTQKAIGSLKSGSTAVEGKRDYYQINTGG